MRIVLASSEAVPFSKTGGLADVTSALAKALSAAGHHVWLIVPNYPQVQAKRGECPLIKATGHAFQIHVGSRQVAASLFWSELPGSDVTVFLVDQSDYFDRTSLYGDKGEDYRDNCERFVFFSRSVLEIARKLFLRPDIVHANDWQTGLIPALLGIEYQHVSGFERTASVFTIHNMAFQGVFWHWDMLLTGLDWKYFNWRQMEAFGDLNLLKTGIAFADRITTVSPTYAREIQTLEGGFGLHGILAGRRDDLVGILNRVDTTVWNPRSDPHIAQNYSLNDLLSGSVHGKAACKTHLQQITGLPAKNDVPLFGMISRMTEQKGFDLIAQTAGELLEHDLQMCFLGTGEPFYEDFLTDLAKRYPQKVAVRIGFDEGFAHQIEAGADAYLMPSRFEPCGLNQMYSLIYGTVPVVRTVGGLADSVVDCTPETLRTKAATGFRFDEYTGEAFAAAVRRALDAHRKPETWKQLIANGMRQDWSWARSAEEYAKVYEQAQTRRRRRQ
jgi:starch synthase